MNAELNDFIESLNLDYTAVFVPFSQSRNKNAKDPSLNWIVTVKRCHVELTTDYSQGLGHCPAYETAFPAASRRPDDWYRAHAIRFECERGEICTDVGPNGYAFTRRKRLPAPALTNVLCSLIRDADALNYSTFEEWADYLGFDPDSRAAEQLYRDCVTIALKLREMFDAAELAKLSQLFENY